MGEGTISSMPFHLPSLCWTLISLMKMIVETECLGIILQNVPSFHSDYQDYLDYWEGDKPGLCNEISAFSRFVIDLIVQEQLEELPKIFEVVELLLVDGEAKVKDAAATCFLENLLNKASAGEIKPEKFVPLLGPESRTYCKAWDEFTRVYTEGL